MADTQIDSLQIRIVSNGENAANAINSVSQAVKSLSAGKKANQTIEFLRQLSDTMARIRTSSTAASSIKMIADSVSTLRGVGSLTKTIGNIQAIAPAINALHAADISGVSEKVATLAQSLTAMSGLKGLSSFGTAMRSLKDLPSITEKLTPEVLDSFGEKIQKISDIMTPLSQKMTSVKQGFQSMNKPIRQTTQATQELSSALSNINLAAIISNIRTGYNLIRQVAETVLKLTDDVVDFDGIVERFRRGFGDSAQEAYSWIQRLNKEMGLNVQVFMQYTSIFAQMLEGLGVAQKDASKMAIGYSELAYDIWAAYNDIYESYGDAVAAVQSAIAGQTRPLRRAGFSVLNITLEQTAANHGLEISIQKATEAEKSYLRYLSLVDQAQAQGIIGTYAKEMKTAEGQLRTLGQMFRSLTQEAGNLLLPLLTVVVPRVQAAVKLISQAIQKLAAMFGVQMHVLDWGGSSGFTAAVEGAEDAAEGIESAMGGAAGSAKELKKTLLGIDEINQLNGADKSSGGGGGGGGSSVNDALSGIDWDVSSLWTEAIFKDINNQVDAIVEKFKDFLPIIEKVGAIVAGLSLGMLIADAELAKIAFKALGGILLDVGLNIAFTHMTLNADLSQNPEVAFLGVLGEWIASAGAGLMIGKAIGNTQLGLGIGLGIGAVTQIVVTAVEVSKGDAIMFSGNWWLQQLSSLVMGAAAGFAIGGPTGLLIGLGVTLAIQVVSSIIAWENGGRGWKELEEQFGKDLGLTDEEIHLYASNVILTPRKVTIGGESMAESDAVELLAKVKVNLEQAKSDIQSSMLSLEQDLTKLRLGIEVNEATLQSDVKKYIDSVQSYIDNTYQEGALSLSLLGLDDSNMQDFLDDWYSSDKLSRLTGLLNEVVSNGTLSLSNGFQMVIDPAQKANVIADLQRQIQEIVDEAAQLRYEASLTGLELRTEGELGAHELVSAIQEAVDILAERQTALDQSMDTDILIAKQAYLKALEDGLLTPEEAQKIYDQNLQDIFNGWATKSTELTQQILTFGLGKITQNMGVNIDTLMSDLTSHAKVAEGQSFQELADDMSVQIGYMQNSVDADTKAAIEIIMKSMMPSVQQQQRVVSEMIKAGQKVDKGLIDGINDSMLLATLYGDANAIMYTTGWQMSQSPTFYEALANTKGAFAELDEYARQGLANNVSIVYDAAGNLVLTTSDGIQHNLGPVTETLKANFEALGIALPESVGTGMDTGTSTTFGGDSGPVNNLYKAVDSKFVEKFVPGHFSQYGQNVRNGFKSGSTPSSSEFNATAQQYQSYVKSALGQYMNEKEFVKYGQAVPAGTKTGMGNGSDLSSHASWILRNINPKTDEVINGMKNIGGNLVKGIIEGMDKESKSQTTSNGIKNVGNKILSLTKYHTEIGSPSKLFADQVGYWLTQGIVVGMDQPDALIDPLETMYTNAKDWWDDNTMDIVGGDFEFTDESGKNHYMDIKDANNEQNTLLREQNALLRAILEKESSGGYYGTSGEAMLEAASHLNRRTGRTMIPVGG